MYPQQSPQQMMYAQGQFGQSQLPGALMPAQTWALQPTGGAMFGGKQLLPIVQAAPKMSSRGGSRRR